MVIKENKKQSISNVISQSRADLIAKNREKLSSIIQTIVFCGAHDLALRGKRNLVENVN